VVTAFIFIKIFKNLYRDIKELLYNINMNEITFCGCGKVIPFERAELGYKICVSCAGRVGTPKVKGRMVFGHKTAGSIEIMSAESFEANKKYFVPNGPRSSVKNFMRG
tara:strand:- start:183 stop:506 length:324 start_codon:yes stop_codon:yes gene_type:complete